MGQSLNHIIFQPPTHQQQATIGGGFTIDNCGCVLPHGDPRGYQVVVYHGDPKPAHTIVYCHGNAEDVENVAPMAKEMSRVLHCTVVAFDYAGYGTNRDRPTPHNFYTSVDAIMAFCRQAGYDNVVAYGRSLGSAAAIYAAEKHRSQVSHLIVESGFLSILTTTLPKFMVPCFDVFKNEEIVKKLRLPTLVMHGQEDRVVPFWHGTTLYDLLPTTNKQKLWFEGGTHNNLQGRVTKGGQSITSKVSLFLNIKCKTPPRWRRGGARFRFSTDRL
jgi:pimeloyl-ACP methyl ester carboxylesterase